MLTFGNALKLRRGGQWIEGAGSDTPVLERLEPIVLLDANELSLSDGDPVASWTDLSGNGNHATQATSGLRPTFKTGIVNGNAVVRFADDALVVPTGLLNGKATATIAAVFGNATNHGGGAIGVLSEFGASWSSGAVVPSFNSYVATTGGFEAGASSGSNFNTRGYASSVASGWFLVVFGMFLGSGGANVTTLHVNNSAQSIVGGNSNAITGTFGNHPINMGARNQSQHFFLGDIALWALWDTLLSTRERQDLWEYADARFGIS